MKQCRYWSRLWLAACVMAVMLLGGCAFNRSMQPETYQVQPGDTLSAIARAHGLDWHRLARWNRIPPPYTIHVGQRLSLDPFAPLDYGQLGGQQRPTGQRHPTPRSTVTPVRENRSYTVSPLSGGQQQGSNAPRRTIGPGAEQPRSAAGTTGSWNGQMTQPPRLGTPQSPPPVLPPVVQGAQPAGQAPLAEQQPQPAQAPAEAAQVLTNEAGWRWPLASSILASHEIESARHGINLYGVEGAPVYAAHAGNVVYSGAGLQGIGQLVIIKHKGEYLSAYGYVTGLQVEDGDKVSAGTHIADMGIGPGSRAELHFEVRHKGEPIDPKSVLPKL